MRHKYKKAGTQRPVVGRAIPVAQKDGVITGIIEAEGHIVPRNLLPELVIIGTADKGDGYFTWSLPVSGNPHNHLPCNKHRSPCPCPAE